MTTSILRRRSSSYAPFPPLLLLLSFLLLPALASSQDITEANLAMELHTLILVQGRPTTVTCSVTSPIRPDLNNTVDFIQELNEIPPEEPDWWIRLTHNEALAGGNPDFYELQVTHQWNREEGLVTSNYDLVFKNPRPRDGGFLICRLWPDPRVSPPHTLSMSRRRYVLVYDPRG